MSCSMRTCNCNVVTYYILIVFTISYSVMIDYSIFDRKCLSSNIEINSITISYSNRNTKFSFSNIEYRVTCIASNTKCFQCSTSHSISMELNLVKKIINVSLFSTNSIKFIKSFICSSNIIKVTTSKIFFKT